MTIQGTILTEKQSPKEKPKQKAHASTFYCPKVQFKKKKKARKRQLNQKHFKHKKGMTFYIVYKNVCLKNVFFIRSVA